MITSTEFQRVVKELCGLVGFTDHEMLVNGGKLRINEYLVSFIYDEGFNPNQLFVYVDMGIPASDREDAYKVLLKINFELAAGIRGVLSIHPQTNHLFYSFCYALNSTSTGRHLLDSLIRFVGDVGLESLDLPQDVQHAKESNAAASRKNASRKFEESKGISNLK